MRVNIGILKITAPPYNIEPSLLLFPRLLTNSLVSVLPKLLIIRKLRYDVNYIVSFGRFTFRRLSYSPANIKLWESPRQSRGGYLKLIVDVFCQSNALKNEMEANTVSKIFGKDTLGCFNRGDGMTGDIHFSKKIA